MFCEVLFRTGCVLAQGILHEGCFSPVRGYWFDVAQCVLQLAFLSTLQHVIAKQSQETSRTEEMAKFTNLWVENLYAQCLVLVPSLFLSNHRRRRCINQGSR